MYKFIMKCCCRCGRMVAEFDNHADGCRSCKGCSVDVAHASF